MAGSVNKVILVGNVGKEPEVRISQTGAKIVTMSLATSEAWNDRASGERKERTEWHRVVIFNEGIAGVTEKYVNKGSKIYLEGSLQTRKWTDQSGQERYSTEVVLSQFNGRLVLLGDPRGAGEYASPAAPSPAAPRAPVGPGSMSDRFRAPEPSDLDDDIPF